MRSTILAFTVSIIFVACSSKQNSSEVAIKVDSTPFLEDRTAFDTPAVQTTAVDTMRAQGVVPGAKRVIVTETRNPDGSVTKTTTTEFKDTAIPKAKAAAPVAKKPATRATTSTASTGTSTETTKKKKGWSNKAKGAVIGGAGGAAVGAIVSKKKVQGAVIGGVIGAAGGYIIGDQKDKKKKKKTVVKQN